MTRTGMSISKGLAYVRMDAKIRAANIIANQATSESKLLT